MSELDADALRERARTLGFTRVRFSPIPAPAPGLERYDAFLGRGHHAGMDWMRRGRDARAAPASLVPAGRAAIALGIEYGGLRPPDPVTVS